VYKKHLVESKLIERNFVRTTLLLPTVLFLGMAMVSRHGPSFIWLFCLIMNIGIIISGIALTIEARKRKPIFWVLLGATLLACSYVGIPLIIGL